MNRIVHILRVLVEDSTRGHTRDVNNKHDDTQGGYYFVNFETTAEKVPAVPSKMACKAPKSSTS